jgi:hypothetical protein
MALDLEAAMKRFFASAPQTIHSIQTLQISHSAMTQTWTLWREPYTGTITTEAGLVLNVLPANIEITLAGSPVHLDQQFTIKLGLVDIQDQFRREMDAVPIDTREKVQITYREYLSNDLSHPQAIARLQMEAISYIIGAANISAASPRLNVTRTGETYNPRDIPMLRGFL